MPLASSGTMSIGGTTANRSINLELGRAQNATSSLGETALRNLAGVPTGAISLSNFYGKSSVSYTNPAGFDTGYYTDQQFYGTQSYLYLSLSTSGLWEITNGVGQAASGSWASPSATGLGNNFYYRRVRNSVALGNDSTYDDTTGWYQGTGVSVFVESTTSGLSVAQVIANYTVQVSTTASTAGLITQGTFTFSTYSSPNQPN